jgi:hypothetical protein
MLRKLVIVPLVVLASLSNAYAETPFLDSDEQVLAEKVKKALLALPENLGECQITQPEFLEGLGIYKDENGVAFTVTNGNEELEMLVRVPATGGPFYENFFNEQNGTFNYRSEMIVKWTSMWKTFDYEVKGQFDARGFKSLTIVKYTFEPKNDAFGLPGYWYRDLIDQQEINCVR